MRSRAFAHCFFFVHRFTEVLQCAEDFIVDIPKLWEYLAEMVEPIFEEGVVNFNFLGQLSVPLGSFATNFVAAILRELVKAQVKRLHLRFVAHFVSTRLTNR